MSLYSDPIGTVYVNGTFNGWCGDCNPMNDAGSGMWKVTLPLAVGESIEYKFTIDGWNVEEVFAGGESCTVTDASGQYTNRYFMVEPNDPSIPLVCWESCEPCAVSVEEQSSSFTVAPNPFNSEIEISSEASMKQIRIVDLSGKTVKLEGASGSYLKLNLDHLRSGVYTIVVETEDSISTSRIIKK